LSCDKFVLKNDGCSYSAIGKDALLLHVQFFETSH